MIHSDNIEDILKGVIVVVHICVPHFSYFLSLRGLAVNFCVVFLWAENFLVFFCWRLVVSDVGGLWFQMSEVSGFRCRPCWFSYVSNRIVFLCSSASNIFG